MSSRDLFPWSESYVIGVQEVDEQHRVLIGLLNQLHQAVCEPHGMIAAREILDHLAEYTRTHFRLEESLMRHIRYPDFESHRQKHEEMATRMADLLRQLDEKSTSLDPDLLHSFKDWLNDHLAGTDRQLGIFFQTAGLAHYSAWSNEVQSTMRKKKWWWKFQPSEGH